MMFRNGSFRLQLPKSQSRAARCFHPDRFIFERMPPMNGLCQIPDDR